MKLLKETEIDKLVLTLSVILNVDIPDVSLQSEELMTWDQIKLMSENGMHFGSHSHKHHILTLQTEDELRENLKQSKDILESYLKKKIETIAYPVGSYSDFNENSKKIVQDVGFKIGFSYLTGVNEVGKIDPFDVKRIGIQPQWKNLDYVLAFPNRAFPEGSRCE
jgi:peptidoglycan/xylan/chitin deacetylase (PgdA/CDA1 family)